LVSAAARERYLLDTNVVSELRKGSRCAPGVQNFAVAVPPVACFLSVLTIAEIRIGIDRAPDALLKAELTTWLGQDLRRAFARRILPVDEEVLVDWRRLTLAATRAGGALSPPDVLLSATARHHRLVMVTRNVRDFVRAGVTVLDPWAFQG
jgi:predicted nucleic acid-binding protein